MEGWVRETAALTALAGVRCAAPTIIAAGASPPVVVMTDLGTGGSLATALLGPSAEVAARVLKEWAVALADLHAATWGNVADFELALAERSGSMQVLPDALPDLFTQGIERLRQAAGSIGVEVTGDVGEELLRIVEDLNDVVSVISPSDVCPDNNVRTAAGLVLIDFEGATVAHPAWDLAYLRVPWPSCWCAWQLPSDVSYRTERAWMDRLSGQRAARGLDSDRESLVRAIDVASLAWCLITVGWFLPGALDDRRAGGAGANAPRFRAVIRHRLAILTTSDEVRLSAGRQLAHELSAVVSRDWQSETLPLAPAFRNHR